MVTFRKTARFPVAVSCTLMTAYLIYSYYVSKTPFTDSGNARYYNGPSCLRSREDKAIGRTNTEDADVTGELFSVYLEGIPVLYLYAAYFDDRDTLPSVYVRITGMLHRNYLHHLDKLYCYVWLSGSARPVHIEADADVIWKYSGTYQAVMLSCPLSRIWDDHSHHPTRAYVGQTAEPNTNRSLPIRIRGAKDGGSLAVCTKVTYGRPNPVRLVEWIELNALLGVRSIYVYNTSIQGPSNRVLRHYADRRIVSLRQHGFPSVMSTTVLNQTFPTSDFGQNWELEILSINDCLYTAAEPYLAVIDLDEILYPDGHGSVSGFLASRVVTGNVDVASFVFHTAVYSDELEPNLNASGAPWYLHTLRHNRRTRIDWESPKSITRGRLCVYHAHHMCFRTPSGFRLRYDVDHRHGHLRHYRERCRLTGEPNKCQKLLQNPETDRSLERFLPELEQRVREALVELELFNNNTTL